MGLRDQEVCPHDEARGSVHRCPDCGGIMRRCCLSTVGCHHEASCPALTAALLARAAKEEGGE